MNGRGPARGWCFWDLQAISKHLSNIFESLELAEDSVVSVLETTAADGKRYRTKHYNLDANIAAGYRVNSHQATQFRTWATKTLKEFVIKGFVLDDERLKQGDRFGRDYFEELLERLREIRASERRSCQKIADRPDVLVLRHGPAVSAQTPSSCAILPTCRCSDTHGHVEQVAHVWDASPPRKGPAMTEHHALDIRTYDRMFPNQDTLPRGGFGNLVALPLSWLTRDGVQAGLGAAARPWGAARPPPRAGCENRTVW